LDLLGVFGGSNQRFSLCLLNWCVPTLSDPDLRRGNHTKTNRQVENHVPAS
jgi:hypothetical protein